MKRFGLWRSSAKRLSWEPEEISTPTDGPVFRTSTPDNSRSADKRAVFEYSSSAIRFRLARLKKTINATRTTICHDTGDELHNQFKAFFTKDIEPLLAVITELDQKAEQSFKVHTNITIPKLIQVSTRGILPVTTVQASPVEAIRLLEAHITDKLTTFQKEKEDAVIATTADKLLTVTKAYRAERSHNRSPTEKVFVEELLKIQTRHPSRIKKLSKINELAQKFVNEKKTYLMAETSHKLEEAIAQIFHPNVVTGYQSGTSPLEGYEAFTKLHTEVAKNENEAQAYLEELRERQSKILGNKILFTLTTLGITLQSNKKIVRNLTKDSDTFIIPVIYLDQQYDLVVTCELADRTDPSRAKITLADIQAPNSSRKVTRAIKDFLTQHKNIDLSNDGDHFKQILININDTAEREASLQNLQRTNFQPRLVALLSVAAISSIIWAGQSIRQSIKKLTSDSPAIAQTTAPRQPLPPPITLGSTSPGSMGVTPPVITIHTPQPTIISTASQTAELASITIPDERCANAEWALAQTLRIAERSTHTTRNAVAPILAANSIPRAAHLLAHRGDSLVTRARRAAILERPGDNDSAIRINTFRARGGFHTSPGDGFKLVESVAPDAQVRTLQFVHIANNVELYRVDLASTSPSSSDTAQTASTTVSATPFVRVANSPVASAVFDVDNIDPIADLTAIDSKCRASSTISLPQVLNQKHSPFGSTKGLSTKPIVTQRNINNDHDNKYWDPNGKIYQTFMQPTVETRYIEQDSWKHRIYMQSVKANMWMQSSYVTIKSAFGKVQSWFSRTN